ncbi:MAG: AAA family ATPase, partial [Methanoregulaceae archaeon]|nr:AAA family ATPase [Methanoregulaceae archaeon]
MKGDNTSTACSLPECSGHLKKITQEMQGAIVGQQDVIDQLLVALLAGGHVLLEGVPGIAKTLIIRSLSRCLDCNFARIQFTPDLLPADITGTRIFDRNTGTFSTEKGPIFHNFILADEINRAPPKVQSALLEAMQERQVTIQGETWALDAPFFVLATENPIESEGTYPLPEAQLDRFMFKVLMTHPGLEDEIKILERYTGSAGVVPQKIVDSGEILAMQALTRSIRTERRVLQYAAGIVDATRHPDRYSLGFEDYVAYGASPRASLALVLGGKARAVMNERAYVIPEDIKAVAPAALRHRILLTFEAETD